MALGLCLLTDHGLTSPVPQSRFWGFDGSSLDVVSVDGPLPEEHLLLQFLTALAQLCCVRESCVGHAGCLRPGLGCTTTSQLIFTAKVAGVTEWLNWLSAGLEIQGPEV